MKLRDYFNGITESEITERLLYLDKAIMELHDNGAYVVGNLAEIEPINGEITMSSFQNKWDYLNSGIDPNGDKRNILELCAIGICAYNGLTVLYTNKEFISYLIDNLDVLLENGKIPKMMQEYYIDVFSRGNVNYLNNFVVKYNENNGNSRSNSIVKTKSTAVGRAFADRESAYAKVLILPAVLCLVILIVVVTYFIFFR